MAKTLISMNIDFDFEDGPDEHSEMTKEEFQRTIRPVVETLDVWAKTTLSKPHPDFGDARPCPFAKDAINHGRVRVYQTEDLSLLSELIAADPPSDGDCYLIVVPLDIMPLNPLLDVLEHHRANHFGTWTDLIHPGLYPRVPGMDALKRLGIFFFKLSSLAFIDRMSTKLRAQVPAYYGVNDLRTFLASARASIVSDFRPALNSNFHGLNEEAVETYHDEFFT